MQNIPPSALIAQVVLGCAQSQALMVAARLGVADLIDSGIGSVDEMAARLKVDAEALHRVLRALASIGVFAEESPGAFTLTPPASLLRTGVPGSMRSFVLMMAESFRAWSKLLQSVTTARPAFEEEFGEPLFEYLAERPESARLFDEAMTGIHGPETRAMLDAYSFDSFRLIVDVGGGNGSTLLEVLRAAPRAQGIVFDLPHVAERAAASIAETDLASRCRAEGGSFFDAVPAGADAYILRHVIHDWDDERSIAILSRCREAMATGGKVLVVESVIPPGNDPHPGKWLDVVMLAIPGGRERTKEQYEGLFARAGLRLARIVPTESPVAVIEGVPA